jgi:hypothetical protein
VIGGHRFGARDGGARASPCVGAASGCGVVEVSGLGAVVPTADALAEVDTKLACELDVQAAVKSPNSTIALNVACLFMVIGL